ncbi:MAG: hypothetical protein KJ578_05915 [Bacteroidetes bacterium]|nr:hypothetical protein [Bacteroidota bacterium]MBU1578196.1 hypothetical protein [Bacteroidota bacterium]MBU2464960.1 hypothetical protein [Bacteroidota bacterium]MBU2557297.1 hypothetical protein [Bacteroidota bacterium]
MRNRFAQIGILALIAVLAVVSYSQINHKHSHVINGIMVTHSHPFVPATTDAPVQDHEHESGILSMLAFFKDFQHYAISIAIRISDSQTTQIFEPEKSIYLTAIKTIEFLGSWHFRGPPSQ